MVPDYYARLEVDPEGRSGRDRGCAAAQAAGVVDGDAEPQEPAYLSALPRRDPRAAAGAPGRPGDPRRVRRRARRRPAGRAGGDGSTSCSGGSASAPPRGDSGASDRELLVAEATRLGLDDDDLLRLIRPIPGLVEAARAHGDAEDDVDPPADVLDPSTRRQIRVALDHLGCRDLYDALGVTRDAPASDIAARADAERQRWMKKAQVTAEKTAWLEVVAHAQSHLGSPRSRSRYDRTLALEAEEAFDRLADVRPQGARPARSGHALGPDRRGRRAGDRPRSRRPPDRPRPAGGWASREAGAVIAATASCRSPPPARRGLSCVAIDGQRGGPIYPAAMPELRRRDRDQPGGPQGRLGAVPALRVLAAMGLPGLPAHAVGRRAAVPVRVPHGDARAGAPALRGGAAGVPRLRLRPARSSTSSASSSWPRTSRGARNGLTPGPAAPGRAGPAQAGLSDGAGRWPARRRAVGRRGPGAAWPIRGRPRSRPPGPSWLPCSAAPRPWRPAPARSNGPIPRGPQLLPPGPGDRRRPARGRGRPGPDAARPAHRHGRPGAGRPHPPDLDAPAPRRLRAAHVRRRPQAQRRARSTPATAPGSPRSPPPSSTTCTSRPARRSAMPSSASAGRPSRSRRSRSGPFVFLADVTGRPASRPASRDRAAWRPPPGVTEVRVVRKRGWPAVGPARRRADRGGGRPRARPRPRCGPGLSLRDLRHLQDARRPAVPLAGRLGLGADRGRRSRRCCTGRPEPRER